MEKKQFPRTQVGGLSLPRMLIGTNWILGYSHTGPAADKLIDARNGNSKAICELLCAYLEYGVDALMAPVAAKPELLDGVHMAEDRTGHRIILIDTPTMNVDDNPQARAEARAIIERSAKMGCDFCLIHHASCEQLVNKNKETIERLPDYLDMIRQAGLRPGLSAHMPEIILYSDKNSYDVETYIQIYNCMGFMMQVEIEQVSRIIHSAKKPVMTIKSMAAGRCTPYVGISFSFATLRPCDMVTVGAFTPDEVHEDVEIALAALERRFPEIGARSSPAAQAVLDGSGWTTAVPKA